MASDNTYMYFYANLLFLVIRDPMQITEDSYTMRKYKNNVLIATQQLKRRLHTLDRGVYCEVLNNKLLLTTYYFLKRYKHIYISILYV